MRFNKIQDGINDITTLFYRVGFWHQEPAASPRQRALKLFHCILYFQFSISLIGGAITSDSIGESIFLMQSSIIVTVLLIKLCFLIWKQKEIVEFLNGICEFPIRYDDDCIRVNVKLKRFVTFVRVLVGLSFAAGVTECMIIPIISTEKYLFYEIAFPWDWRTNDAAYWAAVAFLFIEMLLTIASYLSSIIIWYLLMNCSLRYEVLANELRKIGCCEVDGKVETKMSVKEMRTRFSQDLKESIDNYRKIRKSIDQLESFCFNLFLNQFCTSGLCIGVSIYSLAFEVGNSAEILCHLYTLVYNISEIFMITFFGNEILVTSDRLSYCLFESKFVEQSESVKKLIIIFGEYLKHPHKLMIGNLYPLNLDTFTTVLKGAYSMFNILQSSGR